MRRGMWAVFLIIVAGAAGFLISYTLRKERPDIPADQTHFAVRSLDRECLSCHRPGGVSPRSPNHPLGRDCEQCHYWEGEPR